jgi:hypothetical protein
VRPALLATLVLALHAFAVSPAFPVDKSKAQFVGGTVASVPTAAEGVLATTDEENLIFVAEKDKGTLKIPWKSILEAEYGLESHRSAMQLFVGKSRQHFLTLTFKDAAGKEQSAVFELGKDLVRPSLAAIEARSGRKVTYQDEEAAQIRRD